MSLTVTSNTAKINVSAYNWYSLRPNAIATVSDTGVFVSRGDTNEYAEYDVGPLTTARSTTANGHVVGVTGMLGRRHNNYTYTALSVYGSNHKIYSGIYKTTSTNTPDGFKVEEHNLVGRSAGPDLVINKVEVMDTGTYKTSDSSESYEHIYAMGFTARLYDSSGVLTGHVSQIFARMVSTEGDGWATVNETGYPYVSDATIVFNDEGVYINTLEGANVSSGSGISVALSDDIIASNNDVLAVSCMAVGDGHAHHLGYKNGIYKIYQGSTPLYGTPNERITINGHKFVYLAYSPFVARIS